MAPLLPPSDEARRLCLTGVQALVQTHIGDGRPVALIVAVAVEDPDADGYVAEVATAISATGDLEPAATSAAAGALLALAESALAQVREDVTPPRPPGNADPSAN